MVSLLFESKSVPALRIAINGKTGMFYPFPKPDPRVGDISNGIHDPAYSAADIIFAFPGAYLHSGVNTVTLQAIEEGDEANPGANFNYDAIELDRITAGSADLKSSVRIEPTVFFRQEANGLAESVDVIVRSTNALRPDDDVSLVLGGKNYRQQIGGSRDFGEAKLVFAVDEFSPSTTAQITWKTRGTTLRVERVITPEKKWTVFVVPHIHLDVGFTDYQPKVAEIQARVLDEAMDLVEKHPDFRFSTDGEWNLEQFMHSRTAAEQQRIIAAMQQQKLFVPAQYANLLTGFPTAETLIRSLYPSADFSREHGTPFNYANITDVPSYSWSYASILAAAGIKDFIAGANNHYAPMLVQGHLDENSPFWWKGPDGQKILFWYSRHYGQLSRLFGFEPLLSTGEDTMPLFLQRYDHPAYGASAVIVFGAHGENRDLFPGAAELSDKWNSKWAYPRIQYSGFYDAMETIRQQLGENIPTVSGDGGPYWELGIGSDAYYAAMERETESRALSAEKLSTLSALADSRIFVDKQMLDTMWSNILLMDEHTWGAGNSGSDPSSVEATEQLAIKDSFAIRARALVDSLMHTGMGNLAGSISAGRNSLIVFNTLNWPRSGLVELDLDKGDEIVDPLSGATIPVEVLRRENHLNYVRFVAQDIPAVGYKVFLLKRTMTDPSPEQSSQSTTLESPYYRIELDPASGAVKSIYDKVLHRELVNQHSDYRFGQYLYVTSQTPANNEHATWYRGKLNFQIHPAHNGKLVSVVRTPYGWEAHMLSTATNTPTIATEVRLFEHEKKIEFIEDLNKDDTLSKEAAYFAFPLAISHPRFEYEIQTASMDPSKDMLPGAGHEWFSVQHWVSAQADGVSTTVMPLDVPLVTLGDIDRGNWPDSFGERPATIFSFAMNNYWEDNYRASQGGSFRFRYVITSAPSTNEGELSRMGWEEATPLEFNQITEQDKSVNRSSPLNGSQSSFLQVDDPNLLLDTWKPAEDGNGTILRFLDLGGQTRSVVVHLPVFQLTGVWQTDAVERNQSQLSVGNGEEFTVIVHPHEIVTVRIAIREGLGR